MHYEINVIKDGRHFFATHERSIHNKARLGTLVAIFRERFPESEGYEISVTKWEQARKSTET